MIQGILAGSLLLGALYALAVLADRGMVNTLEAVANATRATCEWIAARTEMGCYTLAARMRKRRAEIEERNRERRETLLGSGV